MEYGIWVRSSSITVQLFRESSCWADLIYSLFNCKVLWSDILEYRRFNFLMRIWHPRIWGNEISTNGNTDFRVKLEKWQNFGREEAVRKQFTTVQTLQNNPPMCSIFCLFLDYDVLRSVFLFISVKVISFYLDSRSDATARGPHWVFWIFSMFFHFFQWILGEPIFNSSDFAVGL